MLPKALLIPGCLALGEWSTCGYLGHEDLFCIVLLCILGGSGGSEVKAPASNAGDLGSIPGSGRSPGKGNGNPPILAWKIPWTEKPGRLQSMGSQRVRLY